MAVDKVRVALLVAVVVGFVVQWLINRSKARRSTDKPSPALPDFLYRQGL